MVNNGCRKSKKIWFLFTFFLIFCISEWHHVDVHAASKYLNRTKVTLEEGDTTQLKLYKMDSEGNPTKIDASKITWKSQKNQLPQSRRQGW